MFAFTKSDRYHNDHCHAITLITSSIVWNLWFLTMKKIAFLLIFAMTIQALASQGEQGPSVKVLITNVADHGEPTHAVFLPDNLEKVIEQNTKYVEEIMFRYDNTTVSVKSMSDDYPENDGTVVRTMGLHHIYDFVTFTFTSADAMHTKFLSYGLRDPGAPGHSMKVAITKDGYGDVTIVSFTYEPKTVAIDTKNVQKIEITYDEATTNSLTSMPGFKHGSIETVVRVMQNNQPISDDVVEFTFSDASSGVQDFLSFDLRDSEISADAVCCEKWYDCFNKLLSQTLVSISVSISGCICC
eukprot:984133_1